MTARWTGTLCTGAGAAVLLTAPVLGWTTGHLAEASRGLPQASAFLVTGGLAVWARPENRAARRLLLVALVMSAGFAAGSAYSAYQLSNSEPTWGWAVVLALQALDVGQAAALLALLAVFPDGAYHRAYERGAVVGGLAYLTAVVALQRLGSAEVVYPGAFIWGDRVAASNPGSQLGLRAAGQAAFVGYLAGAPLLLLCGAVVLVMRFQRFGSLERRQTAWLLYGVVLAVGWGLLLGALGGWTRSLPEGVLYVLYVPAALAVPASIAIGILRYRLLDVHLVVRRSAVYAVLWLLISGAYVAAALVFGIAVGGRVPLALAVALTIAATLLAAPIRRRLEGLADRLVFGRRVSGYELLARLGTRLEAAPGAEDVAATVAAEVRAGLDARWVRVVLGEGGGAVAGAAGQPDEDAAAALSVPLVRGTRAVGAIECGPRREGRYSDSDRQLLATLGEQAALAVHNSWLTAQLAGRLEELTASRARIIHAEDTGRRRLERDIHDGVQQELVAVLARLGLARNQLRRDVPLAEASLAEVQRDAQRALVSLQELARGIHPPLLSDRGLLEAVRARTARLPLPVVVTSAGLDGRLPADVEGAAYFVVVEALGNVLKHAGAEHAWVDLAGVDGRLQVEVRDDGVGFDADAAERHGLLGLQDRVEALGGTMRVTSATRAGATVLVSIPGGPDDHG